VSGGSGLEAAGRGSAGVEASDLDRVSSVSSVERLSRKTQEAQHAMTRTTSDEIRFTRFKGEHAR